MLTRSAKAAFYTAASPLMYANGLLYRYIRAPKSGDVRVQLGPGQRNYIKGWINIDANMFTAKCDAWADLRNRLPLRDQSVQCFYSHHVIEHLPSLLSHFSDVFRCLQPGGVYRVGGPNGDAAIEAFAKGDKEWFSHFPDNRESIGGRLENFIFCRQEHLTILTESWLTEVLQKVGFVEIVKHNPIISTGYPALFAPCLPFEHESNQELPHTIILECKRPG